MCSHIRRWLHAFRFAAILINTLQCIDPFPAVVSHLGLVINLPCLLCLGFLIAKFVFVGAKSLVTCNFEEPNVSYDCLITTYEMCAYMYSQTETWIYKIRTYCVQISCGWFYFATKGLYIYVFFTGIVQIFFQILLIYRILFRWPANFISSM